MRKVVTKKVVNVFAIAMLIAGMYSCSSDDDNNDYKEVALTNDWLNGKWHSYEWTEVKVSQKGGKSQLEFKESNEDDEDSEDSSASETYILRK